MALIKWKIKYDEDVFEYSKEKGFSPPSFVAAALEFGKNEFLFGPGYVTLDPEDPSLMKNWLIFHEYGGRSPDEMSGESDRVDLLFEYDVFN